MAREIPIGAGGEAREVVEFRHTLASHHPDLPPMYSTPDMIRLMETAGFLALQPYCEGDEISVGTSINIEHRAASGVGANIRRRRNWNLSMAVSISCAYLRGTMSRKSAAEVWGVRS
jgi:hypothetical protein